MADKLGLWHPNKFFSAKVHGSNDLENLLCFLNNEIPQTSGFPCHTLPWETSKQT